jgi:DNA-binding response OmpR family regulator
MKKILIIEDDPFVADVYLTKLRQEGFFVEAAFDGQTGLDKLKEKKYDLLVLDIVLPQLDGWEILRKIKNDISLQPKTKNLKIIALSNLGEKKEVEKGLALGVDKYLIKSHYSPGEVIEEIKKALK